MSLDDLIVFSKILAGKYSNKEQSLLSPKYFAHINIYFQPINWNIFNAPGFYSEQSYDYSPWSPYRQGLHKLEFHEGIYYLYNYSIKNPERFAGAGFNPNLLVHLKPASLIQRIGCTMLFEKIKDGNYKGSIEPGQQCLVFKDNQTTYIDSKVELNESSLKSIDIGYNKKTNEMVWGSKYGPFLLKKIASYGIDIEKKWMIKNEY